MKAIVCERFGPPEDLAWSDRDDPDPGPGQVLVDIRAAGLNFADALLVQGLYQARPPFPFTPGAELAGEVASVGEGVDGYAPGDRVMVYSTSMGGFAERGTFRNVDLLPIPSAMPFDEAAALLCAHGTAHHALRQRAKLAEGETVLVVGAAGGTGIAAVQLAKAMGARVIAACSTPEKLELARANGADELIDYASSDLRSAVKELTDGRGVDVVYDPVGGDAFDACTRCMARSGRLLVIGFASGRIPSLPVNLALVKEFAVIGVFWGNFVRAERDVFGENMRELLRWYAEGKVHPVVGEKLPMERTSEGLRRLMDRRTRGKLVVTT